MSVSDGATTVQTDAAGAYTLDVDVDVDRRITDIVYLSKPAGCRADRRVHDPAVLPRPGCARGRRECRRGLPAASRPDLAQR
ncbi:MAG: hypothetical protein ACRDP8_08225 [Actinopolymorphaceae bacterium]